MRRAGYVFLIIAMLLPVDLTAQSSATQDLANCAALTNLSNRHAPHRARTQMGRALDSMSYRFADRAMREARALGVSVEEVEDLLDDRARYWVGKGVHVAADPEFHVALRTCRALMPAHTLRVASAD